MRSGACSTVGAIDVPDGHEPEFTQNQPEISQCGHDASGWRFWPGECAVTEHLDDVIMVMRMMPICPRLVTNP